MIKKQNVVYHLVRDDDRDLKCAGLDRTSRYVRVR